MNNTEFKIKDVVNLPSDDIDMTIMAIDETNRIVECVWHYNGKKETGKFPMDVLELSNGTEYDEL